LKEFAVSVWPEFFSVFGTHTFMTCFNLLCVLCLCEICISDQFVSQNWEAKKTIPGKCAESGHENAECRVAQKPLKTKAMCEGKYKAFGLKHCPLLSK